MLWLTGIICLAVGLVAGLLIAKRISGSSPAKVFELEARVQELQRNHAQYRDNVSDHFNTTAELVQHMTESYRDVYQHLAGGAQDLCTDDVASKLMPATEQSMFYHIDDAALEPPKDYAPKKAPGQSGALAENFGLDVTTGPGKDTSMDISPEKSRDVNLDTSRDQSPAENQDASPDKNHDANVNVSQYKSASESQDADPDKSHGVNVDLNRFKSPAESQDTDPDVNPDERQAEHTDESREKSKDNKQALDEN